MVFREIEVTVCEKWVFRCFEADYFLFFVTKYDASCPLTSVAAAVFLVFKERLSPVTLVIFGKA